jgi:hypothetical protein
MKEDDPARLYMTRTPTNVSNQPTIVMQPIKPFVLFFNPVKFARPFYEQLQKVAHTEVVTSRNRTEFFQDLQGKYRNIFAIYRTSSSGAVCPPAPEPAPAPAA